MTQILKKESLSAHTSFRTGGRARFFVEVENVEELSQAIDLARTEGLPYIILGEGSNTLVRDTDIEAVVIRSRIRGVEFVEQAGSVLVVVGAGEHWDDLVRETVERGLSGLENLSWIPGSVGAAPVQNIGAYGVEVKQVIEWVEVYDPAERAVKKLDNASCEFEYRDSIFKRESGRRFIITRIAFRLTRGGVPNISYKDLATYFAARVDAGSIPSVAEVRAAVIDIRKKKLPDIAEFGTAGSFFKNPIISTELYASLSAQYSGMPMFSTADKSFVKIPLAWVLDKVCGLNGFREGNVGLFQTQPLAIVNYGGATSEEIISFAKKIADIVREKTKIEIEWEVNLV